MINTSLFLWYLPDLNWGHTDFQSVALPTELRYLRIYLNFYHLTPSVKFDFSQRYIFRRSFRPRLQNMPCPKLNFLTFAQT